VIEAKISPSDKTTICKLRQAGRTLQSIADDFGISKQYVYNLTKGLFSKPTVCNYIGSQFDNWVVTRCIPHTDGLLSHSRWVVQCTQCGSEKTIGYQTLRNGFPGRRRCQGCDYNRRHPEVVAYLSYHPNVKLRSSEIIYHLDGNPDNNAEANLYLTTPNRLHWADQKLSGANGMYPMHGYCPELAELRKTTLMMIDLECMASGKDSDHKSI